eukprot:5337945-Amphidinium_carterae.2
MGQGVREPFCAPTSTRLSGSQTDISGVGQSHGDTRQINCDIGAACMQLQADWVGKRLLDNCNS